MKDYYYDLVSAIENTHRTFLDALKIELSELNIRDINNVQANLLYKIRNKSVRISDLTSHGYYLGTNVSYTVRNLVENGYLLQEPHQHDRRSSEVKLTKKGFELSEKLDHLFQEQAALIKEKGIDIEKIKDITSTLSSLDIILSKK